MITDHKSLSILLLLLLSLASAQASAEWLEGGVPVCTVPAPHQGLVSAPDGAGGSIIAWQDSRTWDYFNGDIYAQHLRSDGSLDPRWPATALPICTSNGRQMEASAVSDESGGAFIAWMDGRSADPLVGGALYAVYVQRVMADGSIPVGWPDNGVAVCPDTCTAVPPVMASDGQGGAFVAWSHGQLGDANVHLQHITAQGLVATGWAPEGLVVSDAPSEQWVRKAVPDGNGGVYLTWDDYRDGGPDAYCHHVTGSGAAATGWPANGLLVSGQPGQTSIPASATICPDGSGGVLAFWSEYSHVTGYYTSFRSKRIKADASLSPGWPQGGVILNPGIWASKMPVCTPDGQGGALVAWLVFYGDETRIYAHRVLAGGHAALGWPEGGLLLTSGTDFKTDPQIASDDRGGAYIAWSDFRSGSPPPVDVFAQHLTGHGGIAQGWRVGGLSLSLGLRSQSVLPTIVATEPGKAIVAWQGGAAGIDEVLAGKLAGNGIEAFTYALTHVDPEPDRVRLTWLGSTKSNTPVTVYRRTTTSTWIPIATVQPDPVGYLVYEDRDVIPNSHYEYRLGVVLDGAERFFAEIGLETPLFKLALLPHRRNPSPGALTFSITLPSQEAATFELFTVSGRLIESKEISSTGPGRYEVRLAPSKQLASGIYIARLRQGDRSVLAKVSLIR